MMESKTATLVSQNARIFYFDYTQVISEILQKKSNYYPFAKKILAEALVAFGAFGYLFTKSGDIVATIGEEGPTKGINVYIRDKNNINGYLVNPKIETEYDNAPAVKFNTIPNILGIGDKGNLTVNFIWKDKKYTSKTALVAGDFVTDIVYFFNQSMQLFTALKTFVNFNDDKKLISAKGILIQVLPDATEEEKDFLAAKMKKINLQAVSLEDILRKFDANFLSEEAMFHKCKCTEEATLEALSSFPDEDLVKIFDKQETVEAICNLCSIKRKFTKQQVFNNKYKKIAN